MSVETDAFQQNAYDKTFKEIKDLSKKLPEDAIISLAREVLVRVAERATAVQTPSGVPTVERIEKLARALISDDEIAGSNIIRGVRLEGTSLQDVYLLYLAEAARKLGVWWEEDHISLVDVTVGTGRIYAIMRGLSRLFPLPVQNGRKAALFTAVPGETHTIGVKMAADLFRKNGWDIVLKLGASADDLADEIRSTLPRIVGLSAGGIHTIEALARLIVAIRINSPATAILVSGQIVNEAHDTVRLMGPDAMVFDFDDIETEMDRLWERSEAAKL